MSRAPRKPSEAPKTPGSGRGIALSCVVCRQTFRRPKRLAVKAKVCTPYATDHKARFERQPDGSTKKIPCGCCRCIYVKTIAKNRTLDGKMIPSARVQEFLKLTSKMYGDTVCLAFRLGINAMMRVTEIASIKARHLDLDAKPLSRVKIVGLKKKVEMEWPVDIDPDMAQVLRFHAATLLGEDASLFGMPVRTLQHKFKQVIRKMGLGNLSIHALRHSGVFMRARSCKTMDELNYVRQQARHSNIATTLLYVGFEERQRMDMAGRIKWA